MKRIGKIAVLSFVVLLLGGCFVSDKKYQETVAELIQVKNSLEELRENLGSFQYLANDPKISFSIKDVEFQSHLDSIYGSSSVKFKASLKQTNADFPLTNYSISIMLSVLDKNNNEVKEVHVVSEITNGVLALAEEETLYGLKRVNFDGYKLVAKEYRWSPVYKFKPNKS